MLLNVRNVKSIIEIAFISHVYYACLCSSYYKIDSTLYYAVAGS